MSRLNTYRRIFKNGFVNFWRNFSLAAAAMAVMTITLTIILFSLLASATFNNTINQIRSKISVSVYLKDGISQEQLNNFIVQTKKLNNVKSVTYISKNQALAIYKSENSSDKTLTNALSTTFNPLPASVSINPYNINKIEEIKAFLDKPENIALQDPQSGTSYSGDRKVAIDKIAHATSVIKDAGIVSVAVFAFVTVIVIFNTIRMAVFNRRDEIKIMRLLGAKKSYIHGPFVVEGSIYGVVAALLSVLFIYLMLSGSASTLQATSFGLLHISYATEYFKTHFWQLFGLQLFIGISIGAVSSRIATRRYLKNKVK